MVKYVYDAWGNHAVLDADGNDIEDPKHIGNLNPFRYRSYYYDVETGLYYLQTRYYDPETGRFISQDSTKFADSNAINGINLYAYCLNNPIKYVDYTGNIPFANSFNSSSLSYIIFGESNKLWGRFIVTATTETDKNVDEIGFLYAYNNINTCNGFHNKYTHGAGLNLWGWLGLEGSWDSDYNLNLSFNITPYWHQSFSIGLDGISLGFGLTINNTSYDCTVGIGWGLAIIIGGTAAIIFSAGQAAGPVLDLFSKLFG